MFNWLKKLDFLSYRPSLFGITPVFEGEGEGDGGGGDEGNYYDEMEMIKANPEALAFAGKYKSAEEAIIGGHNAEKMIGSSFRLPEDASNLTIEQKAEILGFTKKLRDVPEKPDGYEFEIPEGLSKNEALDTAFRAFAHERGWDQKDVKELMGFYHNALIGSKEAQIQESVKAAAEAKTQFQLICASKGIPVERAQENINRLRIKIATDLGFVYEVVDEKGHAVLDEKGRPVIGSRLDDALDAKDAAGNRLGNQLPILQFLSYIWEKYEAEGEPISASGGLEGGKGKSFFDYDKVDK